GPAAPTRENEHLCFLEDLDLGRDLDVPELTDEELPAVRRRQPAEEGVAERLHESLAVHDALALVVKDAGSRVRLEYGVTRLLDLEDKRLPVTGHQQDDPAPRTHAADPHDLKGHVMDL